MSLLVRRVTRSDVPQCVRIATAALGSLGRQQLIPDFENGYRNSMLKDLEHSTHVHHMKVVDSQHHEEEVLAYATLEIRSPSASELEKLRPIMTEIGRQTDDAVELGSKPHKSFGKGKSLIRNGPHTHLALLLTAAEHRRKGAGSLLVRWGADLSGKLHLPCFLQASEQGERLYQHYGFETFGTVEFDLSKIGLGGSQSMTEMVRWPNRAQDCAIHPGY